MKKVYALLLVMLASTYAFAQLALPPSGENQKSIVTQWIGPVQVTITYNSPNVHGPGGADRTDHVWGELVHYGFIDQRFGTSKAAPWRAGANENTTISFSHPVKIEGKDIPAGTYGLFLAVTKDGPWTWIFSKNSGSWGSFFYREDEDQLRVDVTPVDASFTEFLTYGFDDRYLGSAVAFLQWEKKKVPMKIEVPNVHDMYVKTFRDQFRSSAGFDPDNYLAAARFCATYKVNLDEALTWSDLAMSPATGGSETFLALSTKARVYTAMGKEADAAATMDKAVKLPGTTALDIYQYGRTLIATNQSQKALEVLQYNAKIHPEAKFIAFLGLARGFSAVGNKKEAIKNWEAVLKNVPADQERNRGVWENELKKLKEGV